MQELKINSQTESPEDGLWKSTDGINFTQLNGINKTDIIETVAVTPDGTIYAGTESYNSKSGKLYKSTDNGINFTQLNGINKTVNSIMVAPDGTVWVGSLDGLWKSTDGTNFNKRKEIDRGIYYITVTPDGTIYAGTDSNITTGGPESKGDYIRHMVTSVIACGGQF